MNEIDMGGNMRRAEALSEVHGQRSALSMRKMEIQAELSALTARIRLGGRMPAKEYKKVCDEQVALKQELVGIERQIQFLNQKVRETSGNTDGRRTTLGRIIQLRDEYEAFGADPSRVSSMRRMASEFAMKLTAVIREA